MHVQPIRSTRMVLLLAALLAAGLLAARLDDGAARAQGISEPGGPARPNPATAPAGDRVSAGLVLRELRQSGASGEIGADSRGDPRIDAKVESYNWAVFFYGCDKQGALEDRLCNSLQFFSGYTMNSPISAVTTNKFNAENRFIRAYTAVVDQRFAARISMDVMFAGTGADPTRSFRSHYSMMKLQTGEFRKLINFK